MDENIPAIEVVSKTKLTRKGLILIGATAGLIIAGGYTLFKVKSSTDADVSVDVVG